MFNHTYRYALKACAMIASMPPSTRVLAKDLAKASGIPPQYLSKILHKLARSGVLSSRKGIGGGFFLERDPAEVKLAEVVSPFRKKNELESAECLICDGECRRGAACPFRQYWQDAVRRYNELLDNTSLSDVAFPMEDGGKAEAAVDAVVDAPLAAGSNGGGTPGAEPPRPERSTPEEQPAY